MQSIVFVIQDEAHAEMQSEFRSRDEAVAELERRAVIAWDEAPNRAPCTDWRTCGRRYEVVEYDRSLQPWAELTRELILIISAKGVEWVKPR